MEYGMELKNVGSQEGIVVRITDPLLYDRLLTISVEYAVSMEVLVNTALKKLMDDVELIRKLRTGGMEK